MDVDATLAAIATARAVVGACDQGSAVAERVMHRNGLDQLLNTLTHDECEAVCLQLAAMLVGVADTSRFPLEPLLAGMRAAAIEQAR